MPSSRSFFTFNNCVLFSVTLACAKAIAFAFSALISFVESDVFGCEDAWLSVDSVAFV